MKTRYSYRIYPTGQQQKALAQLFGCTRVVWNDALVLYKQKYTEGLKSPKISELMRLCITQAKATEDRKWLKDVSNIPLQQSINDLGTAYKNFFESCSGKRKGQKVAPPVFKKKSNQQSARFTRGGFSIKAAKVYLAKIGCIKTKWSRPLASEPSSVTVIKDRTGRYFLSFVVEVEPVQVEPKRESIGVDLGLKIFAALSTGEAIIAPDYSKLERKIRRYQRRLSRRQKGTNRYHAVRLKVAKLKARQRDLRKDFLHKLSSKLVSENQVTVLEDLSVSGMLKNRKLARAISQAGWREFRNMCEAKSNKFSREFRVINRWTPTSQNCSSCGYHWGKLDLSVREVVCLNCGVNHCRDHNASKNIEKVGVGHTHDYKRTGIECKTLAEAVLVEPSIHLEGLSYVA